MFHAVRHPLLSEPYGALLFSSSGSCVVGVVFCVQEIAEMFSAVGMCEQAVVAFTKVRMFCCWESLLNKIPENMCKRSTSNNLRFRLDWHRIVVMSIDRALHKARQELNDVLAITSPQGANQIIKK